jgi:thioredoxin 1
VAKKRSRQANFDARRRRASHAGGETTSMSNAVAVTDATFEQEIEKHDGLAVVDFWATWCGPCRIIAPILDQLSVEYGGKVKVSKMDVDANIKTSSRFNVRSIPTLLFFKNGKVVDQIIGAVPKQMIQSKFEQHAPAAQRA